ncbi:hypothetical protein B0T22DRAFT_467978 [Podospora appendiculata]|uniref:Uncharacterized protein n=1 Tax=Podospora appendiculata TaxID=314037 RepID=A0AAE0X2G3_9PEZI|nr:hypothetical protein B0T22DRAFT_467978 [Podospora appendiculata]
MWVAVLASASFLEVDSGRSITTHCGRYHPTTPAPANTTTANCPNSCGLRATTPPATLVPTPVHTCHSPSLIKYHQTPSQTAICNDVIGDLPQEDCQVPAFGSQKSQDEKFLLSAPHRTVPQRNARQERNSSSNSSSNSSNPTHPYHYHHYLLLLILLLHTKHPQT